MTQKDQKRFLSADVILSNGVHAVIRPLRVRDETILGDFYESVPPEDYRFYRAHPLTRELARTMAGDALNPNSVVLVLVTDAGVIGGYDWYQWQDGSDKSLFGICIKRDFQNTGAGTALMTRLMEVAGEIGPSVMSLTVQKANPRAVRLYQKTGFCIVREQMRAGNEFFPDEPEYYMEREVRKIKG